MPQPPSRSDAPRSPEPETGSGITLILNRALAGDNESRERVYALLYAELLRLARSHLAGSGALSLNPSVLVHEAYCAASTSVSVPTVKRDWRKARAFLFEQLR